MKIISKILTVFLLTSLFVSTTGIVVYAHECGENVKSTSMYVEAEKCEHAKKKADLPPCHRKMQKDEEECCNDSTKEIKNEEKTLTYTKTNLDIAKTLVIAVLAEYSECSIQEEYTSDITESPPERLRKTPIYITLESFLI